MRWIHHRLTLSDLLLLFFSTVLMLSFSRAEPDPSPAGDGGKIRGRTSGEAASAGNNSRGGSGRGINRKNVAATDPSLPLPPDKMRGAKPYNDLYLRSLSEKDASKMTVEEFISLRPVRPTKWMLERYNHLFSVLPEVQRIHQSTKGEDEIARAWSLLRTKMAASEKGLSSTNLRRLTTSINHFLQTRVDPTTFKRVQAVWQTCYTDMIIGKTLAKYHEKRSKESMREYWRTTKARSRFKRKEQQPDITLEVLLKKYDISIGDPQEDALNFEERTRFFAGEIRPKHAAVHMLDKYLTSAGCPPQDIIAALGARRHFLKSVRRQTFYERRRERKAMMREEEEEETARNAEDHEEVEVDTSASDTLSEEEEEEDEEEGEKEEPVSDLLHRVDWWMPPS